MQRLEIFVQFLSLRSTQVTIVRSTRKTGDIYGQQHGFEKFKLLQLVIHSMISIALDVCMYVFYLDLLSVKTFMNEK